MTDRVAEFREWLLNNVSGTYWPDDLDNVAAKAAELGREERQRLHQQIMNLPCKTVMDGAERMAYRLGHRDARHAAAELVLQAAEVFGGAGGWQPATSPQVLVAICQRCSNVVAAECIDYMDLDDREEVYETGRMVVAALKRGNRLAVEQGPVSVGYCNCSATPPPAPPVAGEPGEQS